MELAVPTIPYHLVGIKVAFPSGNYWFHWTQLQAQHGKGKTEGPRRALGAGIPNRKQTPNAFFL